MEHLVKRVFQPISIAMRPRPSGAERGSPGNGQRASFLPQTTCKLHAYSANAASKYPVALLWVRNTSEVSDVPLQLLGLVDVSSREQEVRTTAVSEHIIEAYKVCRCKVTKVNLICPYIVD